MEKKYGIKPSSSESASGFTSIMELSGTQSAQHPIGEVYGSHKDAQKTAALFAAAPDMKLVLEEIYGDIVHLESVDPSEFDSHLFWKVLNSFRNLSERALLKAGVEV